MTWTLEQLLPSYDHHEVHRRQIAGEPGEVWDALLDTRIADLPLTCLLARLRGGPAAWLRPAPAAQQEMRAIDAMAPRPLVSDRPRELILADIARYTAMRPSRPPLAGDDWTPEAFAAFAEPGWSKVAMNFRLQPTDTGTELITETRVLSTDPATRRAFSLYWIPVRLGSGLVRQDVLHAVAKAVG